MKTEAIMIDVIIDIIRLLNEGNVLPFQKDAETKIDLYNKDVELYIDYSGNEKKYYYFAELKMDDEKDDNLPQIEDILRNNEALAVIGEPNPSDSYMILLWQIENIDERNFYEIEAYNEGWNCRTLQRQYGSSLYERLALSRNKEAVLQLAKKGNIVEKPEDLLKQPTVLEFLGMEEKSEYVESDLETAIINKLQAFLMEMGKGFLFEKRQKRFTFDEDDYFVDLVLYNRLLRCYVLIDLKVGTLSHQDLGQMQMYVNYYDREVKTEFENPTIGILLCKENKEAMVKLTLPPEANIYASEYKLYLPDKKLLQDKLRQWIEEATEIE